MVDLSNILGAISKIAHHSPSVVEVITKQLSKIAATNYSDCELIVTQYAKAITTFPLNTELFIHSLSDGQLLSKWWLIEHVKNLDLGTIFLCGGWYATLLFDSRLTYTRCMSIDLDPTCEDIAKTMHKKLVIDNWRFQAVTDDIQNINYDKHVFTVKRSDGTKCDLEIAPDTIINTSCEHIENFNLWYDKIPKGKLIILQSNNGFDINGHINCVESLELFQKACPMDNVLYSGSNPMPKFTRFMIIGYK